MEKIRQIKEQLEQKNTALNAAEKAYTDFMSGQTPETFSDEKYQESERLRTAQDDLSREVSDLKKEILKLEALERANQQRVNKDYGRMTPRDTLSNLTKRFSLRRAFCISGGMESMDGAEKEVHDETVRSAPAGWSPEGLAIPSHFMRVTPKIGMPDNERRAFFRQLQSRDLNVTAPADGGLTIPTELSEIIPVLMPTPIIRNLGATILSGLTANLDLLKGTTRASAAWEGEVDDNAETSPEFGTAPLRPKRLGAYTVQSKQLLIQSSIDVEAYLRGLLSDALSDKLDEAGFNGSGVAPIPTGIQNIAGVAAITTTNLAGFVEAKAYEFKTALANAYALKGNLAWVTTNTIENALRQRQIEAGSGIRLLGGIAGAGNGMIGYPTFTSDLLAAGDTIFGNWSELILAQWGGLDVVVNPYSLDTKSQVRLTVNSWWDVNVKHAASFAMATDSV